MATGHFSLKDFGFLPMKDFSEPWDDAKLYKKIREEIAFIESMIKPME